MFQPLTRPVRDEPPSPALAAARERARRARVRRAWWVRAFLALSAASLGVLAYAVWIESYEVLALGGAVSGGTLLFGWLTGRAHGRALAAVAEVRAARKAARDEGRRA